jgi:hypothetical protein
MLLHVGGLVLRQRLAVLNAAHSGVEPAALRLQCIVLRLRRQSRHVCAILLGICDRLYGIAGMLLSMKKKIPYRDGVASKCAVLLQLLISGSLVAPLQGLHRASRPSLLQVHLLDNPAEAKAAQYMASVPLPNGSGELVNGVACNLEASALGAEGRQAGACTFSQCREVTSCASRRPCSAQLAASTR